MCASLICSGGICPGHNVLEAKCPGVSVQGVSVRGVLCPWGKCPGGTCPGGLCPRTIDEYLNNKKIMHQEIAQRKRFTSGTSFW